MDRNLTTSAKSQPPANPPASAQLVPYDTGPLAYAVEPAKSPVTLPSLDFLGLFQVVARKKWLILLVMAAWIGLAIFFLRFSPEVFEANGEVEVKPTDRQVRPEDIPKEDLASIDALKTVERNLQSTSLVRRMIANQGLADQFQGSLSSKIAQIHGRSAIELVRGTRNVAISYRSTNPELAADVVNAYIDEYLAFEQENKQRVEEGAIADLTEREAHFQGELQKANKALEVFIQQNAALDLRDTGNIVGDTLNDINTRMADARAKRVALEKQLSAAAHSTNPEDLLEISSIASMPEVQRLRTSFNEKEAEFESLKKIYGPKHPRYREAASSLAAFQRSLHVAARKAYTVLRRDFQAAQEAETTYQGDLEDQKDQVIKREQIVTQFEKLKNDVTNLDSILTEVTEMKRKTEISAGLDNQLITVIQRPMISETPIWPNAPFILAGGVLAGLVSGLALAFALEMLRTRVRDEADVAKIMPGVPCLAALPSHKMRHPQDKLVLLRDPHSAAAEGFRKLRTSLYFHPRVEPKITVIASANANEGKSYCAMNTAAAYAMQGFQTLLIDGDLRCPSLEETFLQGRNRGMTEFLRGRAEPHDICYPTEINGLFFIPSGDLRPNPSELLSGPRLAQLLAQASQFFARIVIDSAPLVPVSDGLILAQYAQATVLVVRSQNTKKADLIQASQILGKGTPSLAGYVLNDASGRQSESSYVTYMSKQQRINLQNRGQETPSLPARSQDLAPKAALL